MSLLNFPIETEEAQKFWASKHVENNVKSIIAFSLNLDNANDNLKRYGYRRAYRQRKLEKYGKYVNNPSLSGIPFTK